MEVVAVVQRNVGSDDQLVFLRDGTIIYTAVNTSLRLFVHPVGNIFEKLKEDEIEKLSKIQRKT